MSWTSMSTSPPPTSLTSMVIRKSGISLLRWSVAHEIHDALVELDQLFAVVFKVLLEPGELRRCPFVHYLRVFNEIPEHLRVVTNGLAKLLQLVHIVIAHDERCATMVSRISTGLPSSSVQ